MDVGVPCLRPDYENVRACATRKRLGPRATNERVGAAAADDALAVRPAENSQRARHAGAVHGLAARGRGKTQCTIRIDDGYRGHGNPPLPKSKFMQKLR